MTATAPVRPASRADGPHHDDLRPAVLPALAGKLGVSVSELTWQLRCGTSLAELAPGGATSADLWLAVRYASELTARTGQRLGDGHVAVLAAAF